MKETSKVNSGWKYNIEKIRMKEINTNVGNNMTS